MNLLRPKKIIERIKIRIGTEEVFMPLSAYTDLGDPGRLAIELLPHDVVRMTVDGGDAGGAYHASFDFSHGEIVRRRVISGEFPQEVWEETTYSFNHLDS